MSATSSVDHEDRVGPGVAQARTVLEALVQERLWLRAGEADAVALEANRLAICYWQALLAKLVTASWRENGAEDESSVAPPWAPETPPNEG